MGGISAQDLTLFCKVTLVTGEIVKVTEIQPKRFYAGAEVFSYDDILDIRHRIIPLFPSAIDHAELFRKHLRLRFKQKRQSA